MNDNTENVDPIILNVTPILLNEVESEETQAIFRSWGLSESVCVILKVYGVSSVEILEKMELEDVNVLFSGIDSSGYFGDRVKFKASLRQWRKNRVSFFFNFFKHFKFQFFHLHRIFP